MNYNVIAQLLENGISEEELLSSIVKTLPKLGKKAGKLFSGGWGVNDVLNIFSKDKDVQKSVRRGLKPSTPREIAAMRLQHSYNNIPKNQEDQALEELQNFTKKAAPVALGLAAPYVARAAAPLAEGALQRVLPNSLKGTAGMQKVGAGINQTAQQPPMPPTSQKISGTPSINPITPIPQQPPNLSGSLQKQPPVSDTNLTTNPQLTQPEGITNTPSKKQIEPMAMPKEIEKFIGEYAKKMPKHNAEELAFMLKRLNPAYVNVLEQETGRSIEEMVTEFKSKGKGAKLTTNQLPESTESVETPVELPEEEMRPIAKGASVATPHGVGEVVANRNGKALIDIDGKKHQVNEDELITPPLPEKDMADLYEDLLRGIEKETEEDVSRMVDWAGYDASTNTLAFLPHTGALYTYKNISPDQAAQLTDILSTRKSTGENFIGAWKAGSKSPIGASMSALIKQLQKERGGKGSEYEEKFETLYKALEPAIAALKKKKRKKK